MKFVGIDIGVSGAMAAVDPSGRCTVVDLPILTDGVLKRLDGRQFIHLLRSLVPAADGKAMVAMEDVRVRSQVNNRVTSQSVETTLVGLRFAIQCACDIAGFEVHAVQPQVWMRHYGLKKDKNGTANREVAMRLYPSMQPGLARVRDHNRGDAILIAHHLQSRFA